MDSSLQAVSLEHSRSIGCKIESFRRPELNFTELPAISNKEFSEEASPENLSETRCLSVQLMLEDKTGIETQQSEDEIDGAQFIAPCVVGNWAAAASWFSNI